MKGEDNAGFWKKYEYSRIAEQNAGYFTEQKSFFMLNGTIKIIKLFFAGRGQIII